MFALTHATLVILNWPGPSAVGAAASVSEAPPMLLPTTASVVQTSVIQATAVMQPAFAPNSSSTFHFLFVILYSPPLIYLSDQKDPEYQNLSKS